MDLKWPDRDETGAVGVWDEEGIETMQIQCVHV